MLMRICRVLSTAYLLVSPALPCTCGYIQTVVCPDCVADPAGSCTCQGGACPFDLEITCRKGPFSVVTAENSPTICVDDIQTADCARIRKCAPSVLGIPCGTTNWCILTNTTYRQRPRLIIIDDDCLVFP